MWKICRGKPWNLANWPMELGQENYQQSDKYQCCHNKYYAENHRRHCTKSTMSANYHD